MAQITLVQIFQTTWIYTYALLTFYDLDFWCACDDKHFVSWLVFCSSWYYRSDAASCIYVWTFTCWITLLHYAADIRTSIHVSLCSGLCSCAVGCCSQRRIGHKTDHVQEGKLYVYFLYYVHVVGLLIKRSVTSCRELILSKNKQIHNANINNFSMEFLQNTCLWALWEIIFQWKYSILILTYISINKPFCKEKQVWIII